MKGNTRTLGYKHSAETIAKISASKTGKVASEETKLKLSKSHLGYKHSAETKAKLLKLSKDYWASKKKEKQNRTKTPDI